MNLSRKTRREIFFILVFLSAAPLVYLSFFGSGGFMKVRASRVELDQIQRENQILRQEILKLRQDVDKIMTDPAETERLGREEYNLAEPGDIIINLPRPPQ